MRKTWDLRILMRGILVWKMPHHMHSWQIDTACCKGLNVIIPYWWFRPCLSLHVLSLMKSTFYNRAIWIKLSSPNTTYQIKSLCLKPFQSLHILQNPGATVVRHIWKNYKMHQRGCVWNRKLTHLLLQAMQCNHMLFFLVKAMTLWLLHHVHNMGMSSNPACVFSY